MVEKLGSYYRIVPTWVIHIVESLFLITFFSYAYDSKQHEYRL